MKNTSTHWLILAALGFSGHSAFAASLPVAYPKSAEFLQSLASRATIQFSDPGELRASECEAGRSLTLAPAAHLTIGEELYPIDQAQCLFTDAGKPNGILIKAHHETFGDEIEVRILQKTSNLWSGLHQIKNLKIVDSFR